MSDLRKLIEAVEAGDLRALSGHDVKAALGMHGFSYIYSIIRHGSLDAARAKHDALLPGRHFDINPLRVWVGSFDVSVTEKNYARAWLIAILKAYEVANAEAN